MKKLLLLAMLAIANTALSAPPASANGVEIAVIALEQGMTAIHLVLPAGSSSLEEEIRAANRYFGGSPATRGDSFAIWPLEDGGVCEIYGYSTVPALQTTSVEVVCNTEGSDRLGLYRP